MLLCGGVSISIGLKTQDSYFYKYEEINLCHNYAIKKECRSTLKPFNLTGLLLNIHKLTLAVDSNGK